MHSHNVKTALRGELAYHYVAKPVETVERPVDTQPGFMGYVRQDGSVGIRNEIWILPSVGCVGRLGERLARWGDGLVSDHVDGVHLDTKTRLFLGPCVVAGVALISHREVDMKFSFFIF